MVDESEDFTRNDLFDKGCGSFVSSTTDFIMSSEEVLQKRRYMEVDYEGPPAKRPSPTIRVGAGYQWNLQALTATADAVVHGGKSPVSALNELGVSVHYTVLRQSGPSHDPSFTVAVTVAGLKFEGSGHSKRDARAAAARACLSALLTRAGRPPPPRLALQQHTKELYGEPPREFDAPPPKMAPPPQPVPPPQQPPANGHGVAPSPSTLLFGPPPPPAAAKSPINVLYESHPAVQFVCTFGDGTALDGGAAPQHLGHSMRFKVLCVIKEKTFEGYGSSKKTAKLAAARAAIAALAPRAPAPARGGADPGGELHQALADHIAKLVLEKFNELMKDDPVHSKRKVLAGIVLTHDYHLEGARVVALGTGTKCVSGQQLSVSGRAVNDCHAEVLARRALRRLLQHELLRHATGALPPPPDSLLEPLPSGGYRLRPPLRLHLYVSTAPCGDARIFSVHCRLPPAPDRHPNRLARGQLRTKIESGEGTIPVKNTANTVQTWDGVLQGERLVTMSCSDKVARWGGAGLQGSLLAALLQPVYLSSLVLGSLLEPQHLYRAMCGRFEAHLPPLPPPYRLSRMMLARAASAEARTLARAPAFSVAWCATDPMPEIINATTGLLENGQPSVLCKQSMFARWLYLVRRLPRLKECNTSPFEANGVVNYNNLLYAEAKQFNPDYQTTKDRIIEAFDKAKLGRWVKKPMEQDQFLCEVATDDPNILFA